MSIEPKKLKPILNGVDNVLAWLEPPDVHLAKDPHDRIKKIVLQQLYTIKMAFIENNDDKSCSEKAKELGDVLRNVGDEKGGSSQLSSAMYMLSTALLKLQLDVLKPKGQELKEGPRAPGPK
ncbi:MAG: hypothetical protein NTW08_03300 [Gammaproteobacteria bacterium]|nr:hypothetical protein [Gammaproteobacteria bacterium]